MHEERIPKLSRRTGPTSPDSPTRDDRLNSWFGTNYHVSGSIFESMRPIFCVGVFRTVRWFSRFPWRATMGRSEVILGSSRMSKQLMEIVLPRLARPLFQHLEQFQLGQMDELQFTKK